MALSSIVRVNGPHAAAIQHAMGEAWIADSYARAAEASRTTRLPIATRDGDVFRGPHVVTGGGRDDARGILETKREIRELRERIQAERDALFRLAGETAGLEGIIAQASNAIAALHADHHKHEKAIVGQELHLQRAADELARLAQKGEQLARERHQAEEERDGLDRRQEEGRASIAQLEEAQRVADERLTAAQRRLFEAREATEDLSRRSADAGAAHAALVERASALTVEVQRLEEAAAELEARAAVLAAELDQTRRRVEDLRAAIVFGERQLDADIRSLGALRHGVEAADDAVGGLRAKTDELEAAIKTARAALESIRATVAELDIARVTAEADRSHLATSCLDTVQATLDEVLVEVEQLERDGHVTPDARAIYADEPADDDETCGVRLPPSHEASADRRSLGVGGQADQGDEQVRLKPDTTTATERDGETAVNAATVAALSAEEAITALRAKIDRLGPVNMMAIEQFDELETRHSFLTTQRKDLVDSIAQTSEAITRIDETTRRRFADAFAAINLNFQETFSTLFGGGRAGLALLDENDPLESGIEIIAQPPGKRLQSVQLLSGGEKALTAIALMFGLFKYKPSPFCLLDEIDAPLDDANIGRFVEMLRGMQQHTQFILITHNRKTMEIADRLYGVTMEEPGVSKLISVQLN
jgi:chromosome segregation protein